MSSRKPTGSTEIGERIRAARIDREMSQGQLAELADVSLSHINQIELGKSDIRLQTFKRIIEALQVSSDSILRPDVPSVNDLGQQEFSELLSDCTPDEIASLIAICREVKQSIRKHSQTE